MSKLDDLIKQYCPNGVEYKALWELTAWDKNFNSVEKYKQTKIFKYNYLLAADLKSYERPRGTVKILTTSITDLWTSEDDVKDILSEGEIVCIPWGGNPIVQYYKGKFITGDNRIATSLDKTKLSNKFLYYLLLNRLPEIASFYRGSGIKHPDMAKVLDLQIPLPPLPVQEEIVRILDAFTKLTAELTAELTARRRQYEYYRDALLSFDNYTNNGGGYSVKWVTLGEIAKNCCSGGTPNTKNSNFYGGTIPWLRTQEVDFCEIYDTGVKITEVGLENSSAKWISENCVIVAMYGATVGKIGINKIPLTTNQACCNLEIDETQALYKYVFYCLCNMYEYIKSLGQGSQTNINAQIVKKLKIPLPPLAEQERIVSILDRFDSLCNDLTQGLPAEITARKKQYEYYRDKLLSFEKAA